MPRTKVPERLLRKGFLPGGVVATEGVTVKFHESGQVRCHREPEDAPPFELEAIEYVVSEMGQPSILDRIKELFAEAWARKAKPEGEG